MHGAKNDDNAQGWVFAVFAGDHSLNSATTSLQVLHSLSAIALRHCAIAVLYPLWLLGMTPPVSAKERNEDTLPPPVIEHDERFGIIVKKLSV